MIKEFQDDFEGSAKKVVQPRPQVLFLTVTATIFLCLIQKILTHIQSSLKSFPPVGPEASAISSCLPIVCGFRLFSVLFHSFLWTYLPRYIQPLQREQL